MKIILLYTEREGLSVLGIAENDYLDTFIESLDYCFYKKSDLIIKDIRTNHKFNIYD